MGLFAECPECGALKVGWLCDRHVPAACAAALERKRRRAAGQGAVRLFAWKRAWAAGVLAAAGVWHEPGPPSRDPDREDEALPSEVWTEAWAADLVTAGGTGEARPRNDRFRARLVELLRGLREDRSGVGLAMLRRDGYEATCARLEGAADRDSLDT